MKDNKMYRPISLLWIAGIVIIIIQAIRAWIMYE